MWTTSRGAPLSVRAAPARCSARTPTTPARCHQPRPCHPTVPPQQSPIHQEMRFAPTTQSQHPPSFSSFSITVVKFSHWQVTEIGAFREPSLSSSRWMGIPPARRHLHERHRHSVTCPLARLLPEGSQEHSGPHKSSSPKEQRRSDMSQVSPSFLCIARTYIYIYREREKEGEINRQIDL